jgi:signal transduction histidine kinase
VARNPARLRTPTRGLLLALVVILGSVLVYSRYIRIQITHLRQVQADLVDRNRRDSLQLLRIQNALNVIALATRDLEQGGAPYPVSASENQFRRLRMDLEDALRKEDQLAATYRTPEQRQYLSDSVSQFWMGVDRVFAMAQSKGDKAARALIPALETQEAALSNAVARQLVENNLNEEEAAKQIEAIYAGVERNVVRFLIATLGAILVTGILITLSNRALFAQLADLSEQRSELAHKLIATQESTLQFISRELHDEFGQILTAIGSLLGRAERHAPPESTWARDLHEVREMAQSTLDSVRSLSQALHPVVLDEAGVEHAIDWYLPMVERQNGITVHYEKSGSSVPIASSAGIHIYRILQEALNNVVRHSGATEAWVRMRFQPRQLLLEVEDHGKGMQPDPAKRGIGLVAMRERAELVSGKIQWTPVAGGGTLVRLEVPREQLNT